MTSAASADFGREGKGIRVEMDEVIDLIRELDVLDAIDK
jgi:hypothetical protein